jgi:hypothetical protein
MGSGAVVGASVVVGGVVLVVGGVVLVVEVVVLAVEACSDELSSPQDAAKSTAARMIATRRTMNPLSLAVAANHRPAFERT